MHEDDDVPRLNVQVELHDLRREMAGLRRDVADLVDAWNTAKGLVKLVKLVGAISIAVAGFFAALKIGRGT